MRNVDIAVWERKVGKTRLVIPLVLVAALVACAHAKKTETEAAPQPAVAATPAPENVQPAAPPPPVEPKAVEAEALPVVACSSDDECGKTQLCVNGSCTEASPGLSACTPTVHFAFDRADLEATDRASLQRAARCLEARSDLIVTIEGNCDERGTVQYNIALGARRASAVETYLATLGVATAQLHTVSFGKERPICSDHDEECWARNRRADLVPGGASDAQALR